VPSRLDVCLDVLHEVAKESRAGMEPDERERPEPGPDRRQHADRPGSQVTVGRGPRKGGRR
jgi:hypothetical protein